MNLAICLLLARRFVEKSQIREVVEGYHDLSDAAFERTFERDKDELRAMGVPVETGSNSALFPDEIGYRIRRKDFELPPISFSPTETAALGLAATVWESATQAEQAVSALAKLRAAGVDPDPERLAGLAPSIGAREPAFAAIWGATAERVAVKFSYKGQPRRVQPWAMAYRRGSWYLVALDLDKGERRTYKVSRIEAEVVRIGKAGGYQVPAEVEMDAVLAGLEPGPADAEAIVAIRDGRAADLRRRARPVTADGVPAGFTPHAVSYSRSGDFVGELCGHGADVIVLAPPGIRRSVVAQLKAVAGGGR